MWSVRTICREVVLRLHKIMHLFWHKQTAHIDNKAGGENAEEKEQLRLRVKCSQQQHEEQTTTWLFYWNNIPCRLAPFGKTGVPVLEVNTEMLNFHLQETGFIFLQIISALWPW